MMIQQKKLPEHCIGCQYRKPLVTGGKSNKMCHYSLDTGALRGCTIEKCTHWKEVKRGKIIKNIVYGAALMDANSKMLNDLYVYGKRGR